MVHGPCGDRTFCPTQIDSIPCMACAVRLSQLYGIPKCGSPHDACLAATKCAIKRPSDRTRYGVLSQGCLPYLWDMPVAVLPALVVAVWPQACLSGERPSAMLSAQVTRLSPPRSKPTSSEVHTATADAWYHRRQLPAYQA